MFLIIYFKRISPNKGLLCCVEANSFFAQILSITCYFSPSNRRRGEGGRGVPCLPACLPACLEGMSFCGGRRRHGVLAACALLLLHLLNVAEGFIGGGGIVPRTKVGARFSAGSPPMLVLQPQETEVAGRLDELAVAGVSLGGSRCLRLLRKSDIPDVMRIAFEEYSPAPEDVDGSSFFEWFDRGVSAICIKLGFEMRIAAEDHSVMCITQNGEFVGVAEVSMQPCDGRTSPVFPPPKLAKKLLGMIHPCQPYVSNVLVDPAYRRRGIGGALMAGCEAQVRAWGYSQVYLHVDIECEDALSLYRRRGYTAVRDVVHHTPWSGDQVYLKYMRKDL
jgi:ribosomal protein S18 acetylase RimI-like enzyme